uniref:Uncharacterized protein n=1 Tax=Anopheles maculatus TaxID=74869 RepID=A0A182SYE9_9DIPT
MVKAPLLSTASQQHQQKPQCPKEIIHQPSTVALSCSASSSSSSTQVLIQAQPPHHQHHHHHHLLPAHHVQLQQQQQQQQQSQQQPQQQPLFSFPPPLTAAATAAHATAYYPIGTVKKHRRVQIQMATEPPIGVGTAGGIVVTKTATSAAIAVVAPTARNAVAMATGSLNSCITTGT